MTISDKLKKICGNLGVRLRTARIAQRQTQAELAARIGAGRLTVARMEKGDPAVGLEKWIKASIVLGLEETWENILEIPGDPFEEYDRRIRKETDVRKIRVRKR